MIGKFKFRTLPVLAAAVLPAPSRSSGFAIRLFLCPSRPSGFAIRLLHHIGIRLQTSFLCPLLFVQTSLPVLVFHPPFPAKQK